LTFHITPNRKTNITNVNLHPSRNPRIDSVIFQPKHFAIFANWIDKKEYSHYIPYNFNLLYRANKDGNSIAAFHTKCDNKGATIVIAKIQNSEQIVGGYNPLYWESSGGNWKSTNDSFIFSFTNRNNLQTAKVGYIIDEGKQYAVYCNQSYGPSFGGGHDLRIQPIGNNNSNCSKSSYSKIDISGNFTVENYEVFQVIKK